MELAVAANEAEGTRIRPQTTSKCVGVVFSLASSTPFDRGARWKELKRLSLPERLAVLRARRAELVADFVDAVPDPWAGMDAYFVVDGRPEIRYDNDPAASLAAVARRLGVTPVEAFIDLCLETDGRVVLQWPLLNQELDAIEEMITSDVVLMGLADAGAHVGQIIDASQPTYFLTYWVRERGVMTIEDAIRRLTLGHRGVHGHSSTAGCCDPARSRTSTSSTGIASVSRCPSSPTTSRTARGDGSSAGRATTRRW